MSRISADEVVHVARLARLNLTDDELALYAGQLGDILDHASTIASLELGGVPPTSHPLPLVNVFRPDVMGECLSRHEALSGAPADEDGRFLVPRILEEG